MKKVQVYEDLITLSGGFDSTLALLKAVMPLKGTDKKVLVHHCFYKNRIELSREEVIKELYKISPDIVKWIWYCRLPVEEKICQKCPTCRATIPTLLELGVF